MAVPAEDVHPLFSIRHHLKTAARLTERELTLDNCDHAPLSRERHSQSTAQILRQKPHFRRHQRWLDGRQRLDQRKIRPHVRHTAIPVTGVRTQNASGPQPHQEIGRAHV